MDGLKSFRGEATPKEIFQAIRYIATSIHPKATQVDYGGEPDMQTEFMLLAIYNKHRLNLREVCEAIGMSMKTAYNQRSANIFPIPLSGDPLHADIRDVAAYLDKLRVPAVPL